ncbi:MAG TPA: hypothetical protein VI603_02835 [Saprospiraceae bacterium]|nr:hypothetical protein [Saprospiraceae bacterium]
MRIAIAFDQYDTNKIYIGTDIGVFRITDGGVNWDFLQVRICQLFCNSCER